MEPHFVMEEKLEVSRMKKIQVKILTAFLVLLAFGSTCFADTFTHRQTGEVLHGYASSRAEGGKTFVHTQEKGEAKLNLAEWKIVADRLGRNNKVIILIIDDAIEFEIETEALGQAIIRAADEGPLFILLELDTPGGRVDLTQRICAAIMEARGCQVVAFTKGDKNGGAISAGVAVAFACDKIYMSNNAVIGAAMMTTTLGTGRPKELKKAYGEDLSEKFSSAWRAKLASMAEQNHRPGLLARAMVDRDIEVIEVSEADRRFFIEPVNKRPRQRFVHTWSKKGSLLTLTAAEAAKCTIADEVVNSREELLRDLGAENAEIVINNDAQNARVELKRARGQLNRIMKSIDFKIKQSKNPQPRRKVLKILRSAKNEYKTLIKLARKYPDLRLNIQVLEEELNSVEADYEKIQMGSRRR
jgi:membrane-bound ClpP family serine protease